MNKAILNFARFPRFGGGGGEASGFQIRSKQEKEGESVN
jgi:hypothetical protein